MIIKSITLIQPYATLITLEEKQIETRGWPVNFKGKLAIHAGKKIDIEACRKPRIKAILEKHGIMIPEKLPTGCVLSICNLFDCVQMQYSSDARHNIIVSGYKLSDQEYDFGCYEHGRWAWILANVRKLESPVPAVGKLKLWDFEMDKGKVYGRGWGA
jgi:activating signal cointegrator 1